MSPKNVSKYAPEDHKLPPLLFPGSTSEDRAYLRRLKASGLAKQIGPRLYATVKDKDLEAVVRNSWALIVAYLYPKAMLTHVTALTYMPTDDGKIFLTSTTKRDVVLPGITLKFIRGPGPTPSDVEFMGLKASSFERALLENLSSAKRGVAGRAVPQEIIEARLEEVLKRKGEAELNKVRNNAKEISHLLGMKLQFQRLDAIIGALLGSKTDTALKSENALARAKGLPFDPECFGRLEILFAHLRHRPLKQIVDPHKSADHFLNKAFFEAYFSNYIEGTVFEVKEAERIVFDKFVPQHRPIDAHDILGTFKIVSDPNEMRLLPESAAELEQILRRRHQVMLERRTDVNPGQFKTDSNRAGSTVFVHPDYVHGTFHQGFALYKALPEGLARAIFMMFLISEIHPFNDGNGRISRIMMNAELISKQLSSIIIPNVYREDYLLTIKAMTKRSDPEPFVKMLAQAHEFSNVEFAPYTKIKAYLKAHNWFSEPNEAKLISRA